jgi:tetratricopeptide (TPR) repeat protein
MTKTKQQDYEQAMNRIAQAMKQGQTELATKQLRELLRENPGDLKALHLLGICLRRSGLLDQAMQLQQSVTDQEPDFAPAHQEYAICLLGTGRSDKAMEEFRRATELDPRLIMSWKKLGDLSMRKGDESGAMEAYRQCPADSDNDPLLARAIEVFHAGQFKLAEFLLCSYLEREPGDINAKYLLAQIALKVAAVSDAIILLEQCLQTEPGFHQARFDYVNLLSRRQRYEEALAESDTLLAADPENQTYQLLKASLLDRSGQFDAAVSILQAILEENPAQARVWTSLAMLQRTLGRRAEAITSLHKAIDQDPNRGEAWYLLADLRVFDFSDAQVEAMRGSANRAPKNSEDEIYFSFALARALEDHGNIDESFNYYSRGNQARARSSRFKPEEYAKSIATLKSVCTAELFESLRGGGCPDASPIFIVGLPRSGSTLVEQILASHSQVDGTMELATIATLLKEMNYRQQKVKRPTYPQALADVKAQDFREIGQTYIDRTRIKRGSAPFFIDKMPNNFEHIGLIQLVLPHARIIDVRRNPMANGFSAFRQLFRFGQDWSYDLAHIGQYYRSYAELMEHWDTVLPGKIHHICYEDLVADPEKEIRQLLEYLQLEYQASCLDFHKSPRPVRTASSEQVRQVIYTDALAHWKNYENRLQPLRDALKYE